MNTHACVIVTICALLLISNATGANLRAGVKAGAAAAATTPEGKPFTSIFDHPETRAFFIEKDAQESGHMITSAIYAHIKSHQKLATRNNIRAPDSLKTESFAKLAQKHGVDFATLKKLHARRVNPKEKDMEVWFHELAMHKDTHVSHDEYARIEEEAKQAKAALAAAAAAAVVPAKKKFVRDVNFHYYSPNSDKTGHLAAVKDRTQAAVVMLAGLSPPKKNENDNYTQKNSLLEKNEQPKKKQPKNSAFVETAGLFGGAWRAVASVATQAVNVVATCHRDHTTGGACNSNCECPSDFCDNTASIGSFKCMQSRNTLPGNHLCTNDDECRSGLCKGNYQGSSHALNNGKCSYMASTLPGGHMCHENAECANPHVCKGNLGGECLHHGTPRSMINNGCTSGTCQYANRARSAGQTCLENSECRNIASNAGGVCVGNNAGVCLNGNCESGVCQAFDNSLTPGDSCLKNRECNGRHTCIGNNGGAMLPGGQPISGTCQRYDNTILAGADCLKNDECVHVCSGSSSNCNGVCIGNNAGACPLGDCTVGHCEHLDGSITGGNVCHKNRECAARGTSGAGQCSGNNAGATAGKCVRPDGSLHATAELGTDRCTKNSECHGGRCAGNGNGAGGWDSGHCSWDRKNHSNFFGG